MRWERLIEFAPDTSKLVIQSQRSNGRRISDVLVEPLIYWRRSNELSISIHVFSRWQQVTWRCTRGWNEEFSVHTSTVHHLDKIDGIQDRRTLKFLVEDK